MSAEAVKVVHRLISDLLAEADYNCLKAEAYAAIRRPDLTIPESAPGQGDGARVALIAARLGRTRLIDNLEFTA